MDYLIIVGLIFEVLALSHVDQKLFRTWFTPFNLLAWPYTVIVVLAFLLAPALGFVSLYTPSVLIWIVGLAVFWATGFVIHLVVDWGPDRPVGKREIGQGFFNNSATKVATALSIAILPVLAFNLYRAVASVGGWLQAGTYDFKVAYEHGLAAHALQLALPLCVYLMGSYRKGQRLQSFVVLCLMLFLFFTQVKGTILSAIVAAVIFSTLRNDSRFPLKRLLAAIAASYVLFTAVYLVGISFSNPTVVTQADTYLYFARHYMHYLWSGVLAFSEARRNNVGVIGGPWYLLFSPFINIYRAMLHAGPILIAGGPLELGMNIDPSDIVADSGTNVYTMMGTLYYYVGGVGTILVMIAFGSFCHTLFWLRRKHDWALVLYSIIGSWLAFGFFEYYFASLGFPETIVYCLLLGIVPGWLQLLFRLPVHSPSVPANF